MTGHLEKTLFGSALVASSPCRIIICRGLLRRRSSWLVLLNFLSAFGEEKGGSGSASISCTSPSGDKSESEDAAALSSASASPDGLTVASADNAKLNTSFARLGVALARWRGLRHARSSARVDPLPGMDGLGKPSSGNKAFQAEFRSCHLSHENSYRNCRLDSDCSSFA